MEKSSMIRAAVLAAVLGAGVYACATMDRRVVSALKEVETIQMSRTAFRESVDARGSLYEEDGIWYAAACVDESDAARIAAGQEAEITGAAFERLIAGTVTEISDTARSESDRTLVDVKIRLDGDCEGLRSGYSAQGSIYVDEARLLHTLPYEVIRQDDEGEYVYVYDHHKAVRRGIETGIELSGETEIVRGISDASEVIACPDDVTENSLVRKGERE